MTDLPRVMLAPDYTIAPIINGCWQLTPDHGGGPGARDAVFAVFDDLLAHGFTTFDCADIYTGVEELIGAWRQRQPAPEAIQVHTKYVPDRNALPTLREQDVDAAIDRSRRRLGQDRLDLVQFHWWRYDVPGLDRVAGRLCELQARGWIGLLGTTNFDTPHIEALLAQGVPLVSLQAQYSLLDRRPERHMTALAAGTGVRLLPYGSLAGGFLSERYLGAPPPQAASAGNRSLTKYRLIIDEAGGWDRLQMLLRALQYIARRHNTTIAAVAARWVLDQPTVAAVMLGVGSRSRAQENLRLATLQLDDDDRARLAALLADQPIPPGDMYALERDPDGVHAAIIKTDLNAGASPADDTAAP